MITGSRKLYVCGLGFAVAVAAYLVCSRMGGTEPVEVTRPVSPEFSEAEWDDVGEVSGQLGRAKVGQVTTARFILRDREWGFDKLLNPDQGGDEWELEKPYMKIFKPRFSCEITADRGVVWVEQSAVGGPGKVSPKEALLSGNVRIRVPGDESRGIAESVCLLDDVTFASEKSQFSTEGPVKFVSQDAEMTGVGAEAVYNEDLGQLELARIVDLELLHLRTSPALSSSSAVEVRRSAEQFGPELTAEGLSRSQSRDGGDEPQSHYSLARRDAAALPVESEGRRLYYRCVLNDNVVVEYGENLMIFAEEICINNILWSGGLDNKNSKTGTEDTQMPVALAPERASGREAEAPAETIAQATTEAVVEAPGDMVDVVVTCDGGIIITPMEFDDSQITSRGVLNDNVNFSSGRSEPAGPVGSTNQSRQGRALTDGAGGETTGRNILRAQKIDFDMPSGNGVATKDVEFVFYSDALSGDESGRKTVPVIITAEKQAVFLSGSNQIIFEGGVVGTMLQEGPDFEQQSKVCGEKLIATLIGAGPGATANVAAATGIRDVTVTGGVVKLEVARRAEGKLLSGVDLKCYQFDYDADTQEVLATGPGVIAIDNTEADSRVDAEGRFSLRRPCWALIRGFEKLRWFMKSNRIVADAREKGLHIGYLPLTDGQYGREVLIDTSHVEMGFTETQAGRPELAELTATGGVVYTETDAYVFAGDELYYDGAGLVKVRGKGRQSCLLNGVAVDDITYDLVSGDVQFNVVAPGAVMTQPTK